MSTEELENLVGRLEFDVSRLEVYLWSSKDSRKENIKTKENQTTEQPKWLVEYNHFHNDVIVPFLESVQTLAPEMDDHGKILKTAFRAHKILLNLAGQHNRPVTRDLKVVLKPLVDAIDAVQDFKYNNLDSKYHSLLTALSTGAPFLGWVVTSNPILYIRQIANSTSSLANKIISECGEPESSMSECCKSWVSLIQQFIHYVKRHHTKGLQWNIDEPTMDVASLKKSISRAQHLDWPSIFSIIETKWIQRGNREARLRELGCTGDSSEDSSEENISNQQREENICNRHDEKNICNHKNEPVFENREGKWIVENHVNKVDLSIQISDEEMEVLMSNCEQCRLHIKGRFHTLNVECCRDCEIVLDEVICGCSLVSCQNVRVLPKGSVPIISVHTTS